MRYVVGAARRPPPELAADLDRFGAPERSFPSRIAGSIRAARAIARQARIERMGSEELRDLQSRRVRAMVSYAAAHVPFYRDLLDRAGLSPDEFQEPGDLARLPIVEPEQLRDELERFTSDLVPAGARVTVLTSGTTRKDRGKVFYDDGAVLDAMAKSEMERRIVARMAGESVLGSTARHLAGVLPAPDHWYRVFDPLARHERISIFTLTTANSVRARWSRRTVLPARPPGYHFISIEVPVEEIVQAFRAIRPRVVHSLGSTADRVLRFVEGLGGDVPLPRVWVYSGEHVSAECQRIARASGMGLHSAYSAVETGRIAFQCEAESYHLYPDSCAVRVVDQDGRDLPPGETGEFMVSNLISRATVVLNYRLGDRGSLARGRCRCGRSQPLLGELGGRTSEEVRVGPDRTLSTLELKALFRVQLRPSLSCQFGGDGERLVLVVVPRPDADRESLRRSLLERGAALLPGMRVEVELVDRPILGLTGKAPSVIDAAGAIQPSSRPRAEPTAASAHG